MAALVGLRERYIPDRVLVWLRDTFPQFMLALRNAVEFPFRRPRHKEAENAIARSVSTRFEAYEAK